MSIRPVKDIIYTLTGFYRRAQDFPHVPMMDDFDMTIFQVIVTASQLFSVTMPLSAASPCQ
jgi:hypothetical protein